MDVIISYTLAVFGVAIAFIFANFLVFALAFVGTSMLPCLAVAGAKWSILKGDGQQKIVGQVFSALLLALAYWLSNGVSIQLFGYHLSGVTIGLIGALVGLVGVPLSWAELSLPEMTREFQATPRLTGTDHEGLRLSQEQEKPSTPSSPRDGDESIFSEAGAKALSGKLKPLPRRPR